MNSAVVPRTKSLGMFAAGWLEGFAVPELRMSDQADKAIRLQMWVRPHSPSSWSETAG